MNRETETEKNVTDSKQEILDKWKGPSQLCCTNVSTKNQTHLTEQHSTSEHSTCVKRQPILIPSTLRGSANNNNNNNKLNLNIY